MGLFLQVNQDLKTALKQKEPTLETLRMISAAFNYEKIALKKDELTDEECLKILNSEAKKRKDAMAAFKKGGRDELAVKEEQELAMIEKYLPQQLSEQDLTKIIKKIIKENPVNPDNPGQDFGPLMGKVMSEVKGQADGNLVQKILKAKISS